MAVLKKAAEHTKRFKRVVQIVTVVTMAAIIIYLMVACTKDPNRIEVIDGITIEMVNDNPAEELLEAAFYYITEKNLDFTPNTPEL